MTGQVFHILPADDGKWRVELELEGGDQTGRVFEDKDNAMRYAKDQALAAQLGQIIVHGRDGRIQYKRESIAARVCHPRSMDRLGR